MQKTLSYLLPLGALLLIAVLAFRWLNTQPKTSDLGITAPEGIEIEDFTGDEPRLLGIADASSVALDSKQPLARGEVRYSKEDDGTQFSISATLPELTASEGFYQVWFEGEKGPKKAMRLIMKKGGYIGEGSLNAEFDQLKVVISKEEQDDAEIEEVYLEGNLDLSEEE